MTEQEKRDDLILEMAQQLCEAAGISCQNCPKAHSPEEYGECELPEICNTLADYVLRKEEEVQKETAQKFLQLWYDDMFNAGECVGHIEKLAKEMGIKIDVFGAEVD